MTTWLELAAITTVLDTWLVRDPRIRTAAEQAAMDARKAAPLTKPAQAMWGSYRCHEQGDLLRERG